MYDTFVESLQPWIKDDACSGQIVAVDRHLILWPSRHFVGYEEIGPHRPGKTIHMASKKTPCLEALPSTFRSANFRATWRPRSSAFAIDTRVWISTGHLTRTRLPMWHRFLRVTSGCSVAVGRPVRGGIMPPVVTLIKGLALRF